MATDNGSVEFNGRSRDMKSGQFIEEYPRESFLQAIDAEGGLATTSNIANRVGCTHDAAYKRLVAMESENIVIRRLFGQTLAWRISSSAER